MSDTPMIARFYRLSKRNKSTMVPSGSYTEKPIYLKDATTVIRPTIIMQTIDATSYNYVYLVNWNRYYFIADWMYIKGRWEISLVLDSLASHKTEILTTPCNILYASGSTKPIVDTRIPVESIVSRDEEPQAIGGMTIVDNGMVILGITGKGSFGAYLMQNSNLVAELIDGMDAWIGSSITDQFQLTKQLLYGGSASECLRSALRIPILFGGNQVSTKSAEPLYLGNYPCKDGNGNAITGYEIDKPIINYIGDITIPWTYASGDWRRTSNYTNIILYLPFIGNIQIPATEAQNDTKLNVNYSVNVTSGDLSVQVKGSDTDIIFANCNANIAMPTAYGSTGINTSKMTSAIVAGVGAVVAGAAVIASGGAATPAVLGIGGGLAAAAGGTISALGGSGSGSGGLGGGAAQGLDRVAHIFLTSKVLTANPSAFDPIMGKPYYGVSTPGNFTGYVQTDGFQFKSESASSEEKDMINSLMDSGVYIE